MRYNKVVAASAAPAASAAASAAASPGESDDSEPGADTPNPNAPNPNTPKPAATNTPASALPSSEFNVISEETEKAATSQFGELAGFYGLRNKEKHMQIWRIGAEVLEERYSINYRNNIDYKRYSINYKREDSREDQEYDASIRGDANDDQEYMNREYMNQEYMNREYMNREYMNRNTLHSRGFLSERDFVDTEQLHSSTFLPPWNYKNVANGIGVDPFFYRYSNHIIFLYHFLCDFLYHFPCKKVYNKPDFVEDLFHSFTCIFNAFKFRGILINGRSRLSVPHSHNQIKCASLT
jgi:hypothetical protein